MRILQVHNRHRVPGGEDVAAEGERRLLEGAGHEVLTFATDNPSAVAASAATFAAAPWNPRAARRVADAVRRGRPDVVHVHNTWFTPTTAVFAAVAATGVPVVATFHNARAVCANAVLVRDGRPCQDCVGTHPWRAVPHRCYRGSLALSAVAAAAVALPRRTGAWRHLARVIVLDPGARALAEAAGVPADRLVVVPNAVPEAPARAAPPSSSDRVLCVGRLSTEKGVDVLLQAWERAAPPGLRLVLYGDGPLAGRLAGRERDGVVWAGQRPRGEVVAALGAARALAFPSLSAEPGPLAALEAAAAGLPMVVSDAVPMAAAVTGAGAGWAARAADAGSLAAALGHLLHPDEVDRAGRAAQGLWRHRHHPEVVVRALVAVYREAVAAGADGRGPT